MRVWTKIVNGIYILMGVILSISLLCFWAKPELSKTYINFLSANLSKIGIISMVVVLVGILWIVNWIDNIIKMRAISFENPGGEVKISLSAIEEFITSRISTQTSGVKDVKVKTSISPKGLETFITLKLEGGLNIPDICANVQELTKSYLQNVVGVERVSSIQVYVSNIIPEESQTEEEVEEEKTPED
ncbi:MAG TPA: alkaline shock response membrane anchor protein AmaP [bacterium]|nr:alkaline shock response membrane anchor protein AmaP [bacterium]